MTEKRDPLSTFQWFVENKLLTDRQFNVFVMHSSFGWSFRRTAKTLRICPSTAYRDYAEAKKVLTRGLPDAG